MTRSGQLIIWKRNCQYSYIILFNILMNESNLVEAKLSLLDEGNAFLDTTPIARARIETLREDC